MDDDVVKEADRVFRKQGLEIRTGTRVTNGGRTADGVFIEVERDGKTERIEGDYVLVSVGRRPVTSGIDAKALGLERRQARRDSRRRSDAHQPAERLRDRRLRAGPHARAQGRGRGRRRGGSDRREAGAHALQVDPRRRLHLARDRDRRAHRSAGQGERPRISRRQVSLLGERTRALHGRERRVREVRRRREDRRAARRAHDRPECLRA